MYSITTTSALTSSPYQLQRLQTVHAYTDENPKLFEISTRASIIQNHAHSTPAPRPHLQLTYWPLGVDNLLSEHIDKLLVVCSDFSLIIRFIDEKYSGFDYGLVNQALSAALDLIIKVADLNIFILITIINLNHIFR